MNEGAITFVSTLYRKNILIWKQKINLNAALSSENIAYFQLIPAIKIHLATYRLL